MLLSFHLEWVIVLASQFVCFCFQAHFSFPFSRLCLRLSLHLCLSNLLSFCPPLCQSSSISFIIVCLALALSAFPCLCCFVCFFFFLLLLFLVSMCPSLPLKRSGWLAAHCNNVLGWRIGTHRGYSNEERSRSILLRIMLDWSFAFMSIECFLMRMFEEAKHLSNQR